MSERQYSGEKSRKFWDEVGGLGESDNQELYSLGVCLQDLEHYVLKRLTQCQQEEEAQDE